MDDMIKADDNINYELDEDEARACMFVAREHLGLGAVEYSRKELLQYGYNRGAIPDKSEEW